MSEARPGGTATPKRPRWRRGARLAFIVLGVLLLLEVGLRLAGRVHRSRFEESMKSRDRRAWTVTILALGESTTGGAWVPAEDAYPQQLERRLRRRYDRSDIRVVVPPHTGQNTSQIARRLPGYLRMFEPSLVILMAGVNNTWSLAESNLGAFLPPGRWQTHVFRLRRWSDDVKVVRLVRLLALGGGEAWRRLGRDLEGEPTLARWPPEPDPLVAGIGEQAFLRLWRSDVGGMIRQAKAAGADVILMTYPNYEMPPIAEFAAMAATWSLPLVENHESFAPLIARGRAREFLFDDLGHPNARGYAIVADNALRCIVETRIIEDELSVAGPATPPR